ncbi:MAG: DUF427 domain-containing protein [Pseudonocardia sp.]|nr:DUF427 domain-containing protein [Pseudonocardia sp.]
MDPRQKSPDASHPITVTPTGKRVVVAIGDTVIADTAEALTLQESTYPAVQYVPLAAVDPAMLGASGHHTYCPFKGEADYFHLGRDGERENSVWIYRAPYDAVAAIKDHVAFYPDGVQVTVADT